MGHAFARRIGVAAAVALALAAPGAAPAAGSRPAPRRAPMTAAHRTSGVAPLSVFFDCVDTTPSGPGSPFAWRSGVHQPADGDFEGLSYVWDFGDPASGTWGPTGRPRNGATGYTAAHVFETPGVYTVTLSVTDKAGAVHEHQQVITVERFSGKTFHVAASGSDADPGSEAKPFATFAKGFAAVNGGPNRRLLLRRGDRFQTPGVTLTTPGPGVIGAYGAGPRPVLEVSGRSGGVLITAPDWRVMDLDIVGPGLAVDDAAAIGYSNVKQTVNALVLRVRSSGFRVGFGNGDWKPIYATPHDGNAWVDCEVATAQVNGVYVGGRRVAVLGCDVHDIVQSHVLRVWQAHRGVVSNNRLWNPGPTRHALKLHGPSVGDGRPETHFVSISDNVLRGKTWTAVIGSQDRDSPERPAHVVFERNRFHAEASVQVDLLVHEAADVMVRNNVFDGRGAASGYSAISVTNLGGAPAPGDRVRVLHNTIARLERSREFVGVHVGGGMTNVTVRNNLSAPGGAAEPAPNGVDAAAAGAGLVADHNVSCAAGAFVDAAAGNFALAPGSPGVDAAARLPDVREDFARTARPLGAAPDLGAFESR